MDLLSLPQELIDNVLDHAAEELPRRDVHSLILVCRAFVRRLQLHLFRYITLGKPADCEAWTQRHHASPSLGEHVRHMGISHYEGLRPGPDTSLWTGLHELLLTCPNIKNLSIQAVDLDSIQGTQDWPRILKAVERLWLTSCCCSYATFRSAVLGLPLLNELTLTRVKIINLDGDHPPQTSNIQRLSVSTKGMPSVDRTRLGVLLGTSLSRLIGLTVEVTFDEDNSFASELVKRTAGTIEFLRIHHTMLFMLPENSPLIQALDSMPRLHQLHLATFLIGADQYSDIRILERLNAPDLHTISLKYRFVEEPSSADSRWEMLERAVLSPRHGKIEVARLDLNGSFADSSATSILTAALPSLSERGMLTISMSNRDINFK